MAICDYVANGMCVRNISHSFCTDRMQMTTDESSKQHRRRKSSNACDAWIECVRRPPLSIASKTISVMLLILSALSIFNFVCIIWAHFSPDIYENTIHGSRADVRAVESVFKHYYSMYRNIKWLNGIFNIYKPSIPIRLPNHSVGTNAWWPLLCSRTTDVNANTTTNRVYRVAEKSEW